MLMNRPGCVTPFLSPSTWVPLSTGRRLELGTRRTAADEIDDRDLVVNSELKQRVREVPRQFDGNVVGRCVDAAEFIV